MSTNTKNAAPPSDDSVLNWKTDFTAAESAGLTVAGSEAPSNTITFHASDSKHIMTMTADGRLEKGEGISDDEMTQFVFDALKNGFDTRVSRMEKELGELRDEVAAHKTAKEEWLKFANERKEVLAEVRAERDKLLGFYTEIVKELGDDLVLKRFREMRDELAHQKVQNNHNWMFQEISEEALKRAEAAEAKVADLKEAALFLVHHAEEAMPRYPGDAAGFQSAIKWMRRELGEFGAMAEIKEESQ